MEPAPGGEPARPATTPVNGAWVVGGDKPGSAGVMGVAPGVHAEAGRKRHRQFAANPARVNRRATRRRPSTGGGWSAVTSPVQRAWLEVAPGVHAPGRRSARRHPFAAAIAPG
ncbi:MAG: hypothetical protein R2838_06530 [Caldilineaceae bacterium]